MRRFWAVAACLIATQALAGERLLGTITSAGADTTNGTTASPFIVPTSALLTIQCDATAYVITDDATAVSSTRGVKITADLAFPTSVSSSITITVTSQKSAVVRVISASGTVNCRVYERRGNE